MPWTWTWQPYPGVWALILCLLAGYAVAVRRAGAASGGAGSRPGERAAFGIGAAALWSATDWPVGALGAGHLASVHTVQFVLFTLVVPPLLLLGTPRAVLAAAVASPRRRAVARRLAHPLVALGVYSVILVATHLPEVVDTFKRSQLGSFAFDMAWVGSGLVLWWPVVQRLPELRPLAYPLRIGYLAIVAIVMIAPSAFLTFADYPLYGLYELAPRVAGISPVVDQQVAGLLMNVGGGLIIIAAMSVLFYRWQKTEGEEERGKGEG